MEKPKIKNKSDKKNISLSKWSFSEEVLDKMIDVIRDDAREKIEEAIERAIGNECCCGYVVIALPGNRSYDPNDVTIAIESSIFSDSDKETFLATISLNELVDFEIDTRSRPAGGRLAANESSNIVALRDSLMQLVNKLNDCLGS